MAEINLPEQEIEDTVEDIQNADFNIRNLQKKFIAPIDAKRSSSLPSYARTRRLVSDPNGIPVSEFISRQLEEVGFDPLSLTESRAHAFYRLIGLPIMDANGNIFNPGFDPDLTNKQKEKNQKIVLGISEEILDIMETREKEAIRRKGIFERQDVNSTTFAMVLPYIKPFNVMLEGIGPLNKDEQTFDIVERQAPFNPLTTHLVKKDGSDITNTFSAGTHILKPFLCDPRIVFTVMPDSNQICAPFLKDKESTKLDCQRSLDRPAIEEICRRRLPQSNLNEELIEGALSTLLTEGSFLTPQEQEQFTSNNELDIKQVVLALLGKDEISQQDLEKEIQGLSTIEFMQIDKLTKAMKATIDQLVISIRKINEISTKINWFPSPNPRGPEFGSDLTHAFIKYVNSELNAPIENQIRELSQKHNRATQTRQSEDIGGYALPYMETATQNTFDKELNKMREKRTSLGKKAGESLSKIEIITGEVSGLGLIDILAIYTALWAIPIEVLISLLDDNAFERLYIFNPSLRTAEVIARRDAGAPTIRPNEALKQLENKIINLLKFADQLYENAQHRNFAGGKVT